MESATNSASNAARLRRRHAALAALRGFFVARDFIEVDTPLLVPGPGLEPHIDPLVVDVRTSLDPNVAPTRRWLITSPELAIKRLLATTPEITRVFQLSHVFRDGERTRRHLPEFTMLEWYRVGGTLDDLVRDHEELFAHVASAMGVDAPRAPFERATVADLFRKHAQVDVASSTLVEDVRATGEILRAGADFEDAFFHVMGTRVEPNIGHERPIVVERWPTSMAVLARKCDDDARFAERFEVYAQLRGHGVSPGTATGGVPARTAFGGAPGLVPGGASGLVDGGALELSNAFAELTDPVEQRARFLEDNAKRRALGKAELPLDEEFLAALGALPPTAGCALGFDRLLMLLGQATDVDDVTAVKWR